MIFLYRLDWNLLSTATPAINSWLNPSDRLIVAIKQLRDALTHRNCSVMACIMTGALEVQNIHMPYKVILKVFLKKERKDWILFCAK